MKPEAAFKEQSQALLSRIAELETRLIKAESSLNAVLSGDMDALTSQEVQAYLGTRIHEVQSPGTRYYRRLAELASPFVLLDSNARIKDLNRSLSLLLGFSIETMHGQNVFGLIHRDDVELVQSRLRELMELKNNSEELSVVFRCQAHERGWLWLEARGRNFLSDSVLEGLFIRLEDVTDQKLQEERGGGVDLELKKELSLQQQRFEDLGREFEAFSYAVSHDLRAPLRHVDGFLDILEKRLGNNLDNESKRLFETIKLAARQMAVLIDELLSFSRLSRARVQPGRIQTKEMVGGIIEELSRNLGNRDVEWIVNDLPLVRADPVLLRLVLVNLLSNALKFTRERRVARIEVSAHENEQDWILSIKDNGVGFDMKYAGKLFGLFQRLHRATQFEGQGVGLATVRRILQRHGGRVWAEGSLDAGATFSVSLPKMPVGSDASPS
jgi:PAS domain S-box-containing protein